MKGFFWIHGRLGWPLVISIAFVTMSALVLDYVWRRVVMPADTLLLYAAVVDVALATALIIVYRSVRARSTR